MKKYKVYMIIEAEDESEALEKFGKNDLETINDCIDCEEMEE